MPKIIKQTAGYLSAIKNMADKYSICGNVEEKDNKLIFTSEHSRYEFTIDENCIDEVTKKEILLNVM